MKPIFLLAGIISLISQVTGQPVYYTGNYAMNGTEYLVSRATDMGLFGQDFSQTGSSYAWDFHALPVESQENINFIHPDNSGYRNSFLMNCTSSGYSISWCLQEWSNKTNLAFPAQDTLDINGMRFSNIVDLFYKSGTGLQKKIIGLTYENNVSPIPITIIYDNPDEIYQFPIIYGNTDTTYSSYTIDLTSVGTDFIYKNRQYRYNEVDGWGTLETPYQTFPEVLRLKSIIDKEDTTIINGDTIPTGFIQNVVYSWFSPLFRYPVMEVSGDIIFGLEVIREVTFIDTVRCLVPSSVFSAIPMDAPIDSTGTATVNFTNQSSNSNSFLWDFGDPASGTLNVSTLANPEHKYSSPGYYLVKLTSCNTGCDPEACDESFTLISVSNPAGINSAFTYTPLTPCEGDTIYFLNNSQNASGYLWYFGDGGMSTTEEPFHVYNGTGEYPVTLIANHLLDIDSTEHVISISPYPEAYASRDTSIAPGDTVTLTANGVYSNLSWLPSAYLSCLNCDTVYAYPPVTTFFIVRATTPCGVAYDSVRIFVSPHGIQETGSALSHVDLYPNPVSDQLHITYSPLSGNLYIEVISVQGVMMAEILQSAHEGNMIINTENLKQGMYFLRIHHEKGVNVFRFIKE